MHVVLLCGIILGKMHICYRTSLPKSQLRICTSQSVVTLCQFHIYPMFSISFFLSTLLLYSLNTKMPRCSNTHTHTYIYSFCNTKFRGEKNQENTIWHRFNRFNLSLFIFIQFFFPCFPFYTTRPQKKKLLLLFFRFKCMKHPIVIFIVFFFSYLFRFG